jgi:hypothetical protein
LPNCWGAIFLVLPKLDGCQVDLPNCLSCSYLPDILQLCKLATRHYAPYINQFNCKGTRNTHFTPRQNNRSQTLVPIRIGEARSISHHGAATGSDTTAALSAGGRAALSTGGRAALTACGRAAPPGVRASAVGPVCSGARLLFWVFWRPAISPPEEEARLADRRWRPRDSSVRFSHSIRLMSHGSSNFF